MFVSKRQITILVSSLVLALASGCATVSKDQLDEVRAMAEKAMSSSETATMTAEKAMSTAEGAMSKADAAMGAANGAQACCDANTDRIDRAFQKSMQK